MSAFEHDADPAGLYDELRGSFTNFVVSLTPQALGTRVPATPEWTVADVLAHVVGIPADLNHGRFPQPEDPEAWTAAQVAERRGRSVAELTAEWEAEAPQFLDGLRAFGYSFGSHYLGDLLHHAADVRHALNKRPPPEDETLVVATDFYLESFDEALRRTGAGAVTVRTGGERFIAGTGETTAELEASRYDVFRTLGGRRSARQIQQLHWTGNVERVLPIVSRYPLPAKDIVES